jgi:hypothetical protein
MPDRLWRVFSELAAWYPKIELRGIGANCSIYLENKGRVIEVSDMKGGWWLEARQGPNKIRECWVATREEVLRFVREWLK